MDRKIIDKYETGGSTLAASIAGLSQTDMLWIPPKDAGVGLWSIQQIVLHLMDSDLIWAARMKSIIALDNPEIIGFDENKFATKLFYDQQDASGAVEILDLNRRMFSRVLRKLGDATFKRTGQHSERGPITLEQSIATMAEHIDHHVKFIQQKREKMGKPLK
jgi:uncharacterized damage-inducible protein DinB